MKKSISGHKLIEIFKEITDKLIEFLNQIETFKRTLGKAKIGYQHRLFNFFRLVPEELLKTVLENEKQMEQWRNMGIDTKSIDIKTNPTLSIDTALFDDQFKMRLLSKIENLDEMITGILINFDNFHALNLLKTNSGTE